MKKLGLTLILILVVSVAGMAALKIINPNMWKSIMMHIPIVKNFQQHEFPTYTSITNIKDTMKLVTARQNLDFISIFEGKDGTYIEITTFEVKAGVDFDDAGEPAVKVLSSDTVHTERLRDNNELAISFYEEYVKPVNVAYQQKAMDYAVELNLLKKASEKANKLLENLLGQHFDVKDTTGDYFMTVPFDHLPMEFKVSREFIESEQMKCKSLPATQFNRDAAVFSPKVNNSEWEIRAGYSGMDYADTFNAFYENVKKTNTSEKNESEDRVEIFRHFDPLYPKESEVLSYASDYYRTFFMLNGGKIYYIDSKCDNNQDRIESISPKMIYLASSARPIKDRDIDKTSEYQKYIRQFHNIEKNIRDAEDPYLLDNNMKNLKTFNVLNSSGELTVDEQYVASLLKLKNKKEAAPVSGDDFFNETAGSYIKILSKSDCSDKTVRDNLLHSVAALNGEVNDKTHKDLFLPSYLQAWFLQNKSIYNIPDEEARRYASEISRKGEIVTREAILDLSDKDRNDYYLRLFENRIFNSALDFDTARKKSDIIQTSTHGSALYAYVGIDSFNQNDTEILDQMIKQNKGHDIFDNKFVLVIDTKEYSIDFFGKELMADHDYHAFVLDDAYLWIFPNVGSQNILEEAGTKLKEFFSHVMKKDGSAYRPFYFGDWKSLKISGDGLKIDGTYFGTKRLSQSGQRSYRNENDYQEKSALGLLLADFQHAYSNGEPDYYYDTVCYAILNQLNKYVYDIIFRPTPRMILDMREDSQRRYNY